MQNLIYRETPQKRKFGVELEVLSTKTVTKRQLSRMVAAAQILYGKTRPIHVSAGVNRGWEESKSNDYWHVKYDSSCGWEVASFVAKGDEDIDHIAAVAETLGAFGAEVDENCGFHIHVDISDFSERQVACLLGKWIKIEALLMFCCCDPSRFDNHYCARLGEIAWLKYMISNLHQPSSSLDFRDLAFEPIKFWKEMRPTNLSPHDNYDKKRALNTVGYVAYLENYDKRRPTIELRMPECRLNARYVANWIRLFLNFVETAKNSPEPPHLRYASLMDSLYHLGLQDSPFLILDEKLLGTKIWLLEKVISCMTGLAKTYRKEAQDALAFIVDY